MKGLRKLVRIYDELLKNKTSKFIRSSFNKKEEALFNHYQTSVSENTISKKLYNSSPSHQSYQSLKKSLLEKLYSIVLTSNVGKSYQKQRLELGREFLVVKVLSVLKQRSLMVSIAEKTLQKCLKFHLYHEAAELSRILSDHYSVFAKKIKQAETYYELSLHCFDIYRKELEYGWKYSYFRSLYGTPEFESSVDEFSTTANGLKDLFHLNSSRLCFYHYELRFFEFYIKKDIDQMVTTCLEAISYYDHLPFSHNSAKHIFTFHLIEVYLNHNKLEEAKSLILSFLEQVDSKNASYYRYKELLLRVYLFEMDIQKAKKVYDYLVKNIRKLSNIYTLDRLIIYEMYMAILTNSKLNFRKILYNINRVKQDKKGMHVPFLIAQAIYYYKNDPDKLIDKLDALNQYAYKYLKEDQFERTRQFIKILNRVLSGKSYSDIAMEERKEKLSNYGLEMVSYESLLNIIQSSKPVTFS